jgi:hypothetical protein
MANLIGGILPVPGVVDGTGIAASAGAPLELVEENSTGRRRE